MLTKTVKSTLVKCVEVLEDASDPWWVFGSVAMALHGVSPGQINDIDILVSIKDIHLLRNRLGCANEADGGTELFRSEVILRPDVGHITVEIMAGFEVCKEGVWYSFRPKTQVPIIYGGATVFVPERRELAKIFKWFGRKKDIEKLRLLEEFM